MLKNNLFDELMTIHNSFEKAVNQFLDGKQTAYHPVLESAWVPAAEALLKEDLLTVRVFLPGVEEKNVSLSITDNVLQIAGERAPQNDKKSRFLLNELPLGKFARNIALPEDLLVDTEKCKAKFHNGMLEISMPVVSEHYRTRQIPIEVTSQQKQIANA